MNVTEPQNGDVSFMEVIATLDYRSKGVLLSTLSEDNTVAALRLVCRATRDFVDSSITSVSLKLQHFDDAPFLEGILPPFHRWTSCSHVEIHLPDSSALAGAMLPLAFSQMQAAARQRLTSLCVRMPHGQAQLSAAALSSVLFNLLGLERLSIHANGMALPWSRLEQRLVLNAMACLPGLRTLSLPNHPVLDMLHVLAGSLRELIVSPADGAESDTELDVSAVESISQLHHLQSLRIQSLHMTDPLCLLVANLPPALKRLELPDCSALAPWFHSPCPDVELQMDDGRFVSFVACCAKGQASVSWGALAQLACAMEPRCRNAQGQQVLHRVQLGRVHLGFLNPPRPEEVQQLGALLQNCEVVTVEEVYVSGSTPFALAQEAVALLWPRGGVRSLYLGLRSWGGLSMDLTAGTSAAAATAETPHDEQPLEACLSDLALQHLLATCGLPAATEQSTGADSGDPDAARAADHRPRLLLLRGPLLAALLHDPAKPKALSEFMRHQAHAAAEAPGREGATGQLQYGTNGTRSGVYEYLALPHAAGTGAVLVQCATAAGEAALRAAAAAAAAAAGAETAGEDMGSVRIAGVQQLEVLTVVKGDGASPSCGVALKSALEQVAQRMWDGEGPGAGWDLAGRLRWLLEQWGSVPQWRNEEYIIS